MLVIMASEGAKEELRQYTDRRALEKAIYFMNKTKGTKPMTMKQAGVVTTKILRGEITTFLGRDILVER